MIRGVARGMAVELHTLTKRTQIMAEPALNPDGTPQAQPQQAQIQVDDSKAVPLYTNFCRVTGTPEELIIDFGLNPQPFGVPTVPIAIRPADRDQPLHGETDVARTDDDRSAARGHLWRYRNRRPAPASTLGRGTKPWQ